MKKYNSRDFINDLKEFLSEEIKNIESEVVDFTGYLSVIEEMEKSEIRKAADKCILNIIDYFLETGKGPFEDTQERIRWMVENRR